MNDVRSVDNQRLEQKQDAMRVAAGSFDEWRPRLIALAALFLFLGALYWSTALSIVEIWWRSETFTHGFLIVPISLFMIWTRRHSLAELSPNINLWGLPLLALLAFGWLLGNAADVLLVQQLTFVGFIPVIVLTILGAQVTRALTFPLAYLLFAVPFGEFLVPPLMDWTAWFSVNALQLSGIPVFWEGRYISIPTGNWEVAEACSGVRYLIASLAIGCLYAYLFYRSYWRRLAFIALAILVPILANALRAYGIIMLGHLSEMRIAVGVDHIIYGWLFFGVVMIFLFWLGSLWREPQTKIDDAANLTFLRGVAAPRSIGRAGLRFYAVCICVALVGATGPAAAQWLESREPYGAELKLQLPRGTRGWVGPTPVAERWEPRFPDGGERLHRVYSRNGSNVHTYLIRYLNQRQGQELISLTNRVYDGKYWRRAREARLLIRVSGTPSFVHETAMKSPSGYRLVWHWYDIDGRRTASPYVAKLLEARTWLSGRGSRSTLVMVAADFEVNPEVAREVLQSFLSDMPALGNVRDLIRVNEGSGPLVAPK